MKPAFPASTIATIVQAIPTDTLLSVREVEMLLPFHYSRGTIRGVLGHLAREGRARVEEEISGQLLIKRYRLAALCP